MAIKITEVGKPFRYSTAFDLSSNTELSLKLISPTGVVTTFTNPKVTAPAVAVATPELGTLSANTYMEFTTEATDFTEVGEWTVCGTYTDASSVFHGDKATFSIGDAC